ncbi:MAG: inositol monophosphatase family protein [Thermoleophilaceae bacterium]
MERFGAVAHGVSSKSSATDTVSNADRAAEAAIEEILLRERPNDGLLGEEGAGSESASGRRWVVDPLDGTTNYLYGLPAWCVSVALEDAEGGLVGVVHDPVRAETFSAYRGGGARLDGTAISVRDHDELATALVATGFGYESDVRAAQAEKLLHVLPKVRDIRRGGAAALDLAWVAAGRLDGYFERGLKPWDWGAGRLLIGEAGGRVRDLDGEPAGLVAAGPRLVDALTALVE